MGTYASFDRVKYMTFDDKEKNRKTVAIVAPPPSVVCHIAR